MAKQYFKKGTTIVNSRKVVIKGKHFQIEDIRSFKVKTERPGLAKPITLSLCTAGILYMNISLLVLTITSEEVKFGMVMGNLLLGVVSVAFVMATASAFIYRHPTYHLAVQTAGSTEALMESEKEDLLLEIESAVSQAIAERDAKAT